MARRLVASLLVLLLCGAAALAASHGHLSGRDHAQSCAACTVADARAELTAAPALPPAPLGVDTTPPDEFTTDTPAPRPPLPDAPKHGPPTLI